MSNFTKFYNEHLILLFLTVHEKKITDTKEATEKFGVQVEALLLLADTYAVELELVGEDDVIVPSIYYKAQYIGRRFFS